MSTWAMLGSAAATNNIHCKSGNLENVSELTYTRYL